MENYKKENKYIRANERVTVLKKFYARILRGLLAIVIVAAINYYLNEWRTPWFLWVVFGISLGVLLKAIKIFNFNPLFGRNWEERKIKEFMDRQEI